jgi:hypothetical protein
MKGCDEAIRRSGGCYCKGTIGVGLLGAWKRYGSIRARLFLEVLVTGLGVVLQPVYRHVELGT